MAASRPDSDLPEEASHAGPESDAFVRALVANTRQIYVFLATLVAAREDIDDVYQQTCVALWNKRHLYDPSRSFYSWACGFARNEALRHLRSRRTSKVQLTEKTIEAIASDQIKMGAAHIDLRRDALECCLDKLSAPHRALIQRCYAGDEAIRDIAGELRISAAALTMRLQRIRHALLKCIERALESLGSG